MPCGKAIDRSAGIAELVDAQGRVHRLIPEKLATNRTENSVRITREKPLRLYEGDKVRWTDTDRNRGLINADRATVLRIDAAGITFETSTKMQITLPTGDRQAFGGGLQPEHLMADRQARQLAVDGCGPLAARDKVLDPVDDRRTTGGQAGGWLTGRLVAVTNNAAALKSGSVDPQVRRAPRRRSLNGRA